MAKNKEKLVLNNKSTQELNKIIEEQRKKLLEARAQLKENKLKNTCLIKQIKKIIAQAQTYLRQKELNKV